MEILSLQPSQFYLSKDKLRAVGEWIADQQLAPLSVKEMNGRIFLTDGHSRAYMAYKSGISVYWDEDDLDWDFYWKCVQACQDRGVYSIADLENRKLSSVEYQEKWLGWCQQLAAK
ncbi:hypothetical protein K6V78_07240 [Streptococcus gallolyticus]|nr:hypothetical protein [Streptococcus gallolyticus]MBY5041105.1 hypothetical protein [Streptococcus gallolyticus]